MNEKVKEFLAGCRKGTFADAECCLSGYHYDCEYKYHDKINGKPRPF